ncbi:unnamed protein product [Strongylus vulgaris]|uniref:Uncharacterized protein n=1 Tax=Strongylus vulgaris TaxID=40348 RepID=A0A3P7KD88_STRVU|nr:unnamed protein product [Strongylus vulgaris]
MATALTLTNIKPTLTIKHHTTPPEARTTTNIRALILATIPTIITVATIVNRHMAFSQHCLAWVAEVAVITWTDTETGTLELLKMGYLLPVMVEDAQYEDN